MAYNMPITRNHHQRGRNSGMLWTIRPMGEHATLIELGSTIDPQVNDHIHRLHRYLLDHYPDIVDMIPGYSTLLVIQHPPVEPIPWDTCLRHVLAVDEPQSAASRPPRQINIPVLYGEEGGPDLSDVAALTNRSETDVMQMHSKEAYRVYCLGFTPGFPFLGELPHALRVHRKPQPRAVVSAGSIAIANSQTGIYAVSSPGGWQIIGRTPIRLFRPELPNTPIPYQAGDLVRFVPIDQVRYHEITDDPASQQGLFPSWLWPEE